MTEQVQYTTTQNIGHLEQILALQRANLKESVSELEAQTDGFVTVQHHLPLLQTMHAAFPHTIALSGGEVIGYALSMTPHFAQEIPVLEPMFRMIDQQIWKDKALAETPFIVMGQICIAKTYRGLGVFGALYEKMYERIKEAGFKYIVTEIDETNSRSIRAHQKAGFNELIRYKMNEVVWVIVIR